MKMKNLFLLIDNVNFVINMERQVVTVMIPKIILRQMRTMTILLIENVMIIVVRGMVHESVQKVDRSDVRRMIHESVQAAVRLDGQDLNRPTDDVIAEDVQDGDLKALRLENHDLDLYRDGEVVTGIAIAIAIAIAIEIEIVHPDIGIVRLELKMDDVSNDVLDHEVEAPESVGPVLETNIVSGQDRIKITVQIIQKNWLIIKYLFFHVLTMTRIVVN